MRSSLAIVLAAALALSTLVASCAGGLERYYGPLDFVACASTCLDMDCIFRCDRPEP